MELEIIRHLARLSRLSLSGGEERVLAVRLEDMARRLEGLEPSPEPLELPPTLENVFREDTPVTPMERDALLSNAPRQDGGYLLAPKAIGQEGEG